MCLLPLLIVGEKPMVAGGPKLPGLHGLRAVACVMVSMYHLALLAPETNCPNQFSFVQAYFGYGVPRSFLQSAPSH